MDSLKRERAQLRRLFTNSLKTLESKLTVEPVIISDVIPASSVLEDKANHLFDLDEQIKELWLNAEDFDEEEFTKDIDVTESYRDQWITAKSKVTNLLENEVNIDNNVSVTSQGKRNFRLPKLELKRFDGDVKNWIGFWGQFKKIHEDDTIDSDDKFQYLLQATEIGSSARDLVESFPPSGLNYFKAIEQMKSRFARDELLIEIYVRELLNLVLTQVKNGENFTLRILHDRLETQLRALETLGVTSEKYAAMLYPLVESALPEEIMKTWERSRTVKTETGKEVNLLTSLLEFLRFEVESEERLNLARSGFACSKEFDTSKSRHHIPTAACIVASEKKYTKSDKLCLWCNKVSHNSTECFKANDIPYDEKKEILRKKGACFSCLKIGHNSKVCKSYVKCFICNKRHHTVVCPKPRQSKDAKKEMNENPNAEVLISRKNSPTLLLTVLARITNKEKSGIIRILFDTGSQRSFIRKDIAGKLGLEISNQETLSHGLFGGGETEQKLHNTYDITLQSLCSKFRCRISVLDETKICGNIPRVTNLNVYPLLRKKNIVLSDVGENTPEIGLLIGADYLGSLLTGTIVPIDDNLVAVNTKLGWTLQGKQTCSVKSLNDITCSCNLDLTELWDLDVIGIRDPSEIKSRQDLEAETLNFFHRTIKRIEDSRYEVSLPWKEGHPELTNNKELAKKRLISTTKTLVRTGHLEEYNDILKEWLDSGIVELVKEDDGIGHYLPHRPVFKSSSTTTKIRPVFDASARDEKGNSLNNCLEKGPNLIELIPKLVMQFRKHAIGITSDIRKAFLQISLSPNDRDYFKFLWWKDRKTEEIITLRHCRVVFGASPSPFLLGAIITYHLEHTPEELKKTAQLLQNSFYIDNCVLSLETKEEARVFISEAKQLMFSAQFDLRGWTTSPDGVIECETNERYIPLLGLSWDVQIDELSCNLGTSTFSESSVTKRTLLSLAQSIFDPIGYTSPTTVIPKLIIQKSWKEKLGWDEVLPPDMRKEFLDWFKHLHFLKDCTVPRRLVTGPFKHCVISLHCFSDASKVSYAACIFMRSCYEGKTSVQLVASKSRVAPTKNITIPRLELLGTLIATRLYYQVVDSLNLQGCKVFFWSDSTVALTWIKRKNCWKTFVGNRVAEIRSYTNPDDWHYVPGSMNPADLPSRGCNAKTLLESRWWEGPNWLKEDPVKWPVSEVPSADEDLVDSEKKKLVVTVVAQETSNFTDSLLYFSQYSKLIRMIAWIMRFINNCRKNEYARKGELVYEEALNAEKILLRLIQRETFQDKGVEVLKEMQTFKDNDGIIRVRTKLVLGDEDEDFKCPILLPGDNAIIHRLIHQKHCQLQHSGLGTLISNLRENYWIIGIRRKAKKICSCCVICKRFKAKRTEPPLAPLPRNRIKHAALFEVTGIDLAGPLFLLSGEKAWIVLFTCAIYRAVHLELVNSLSTEAFIMALRRFIARRGRVSIIYTDNGTNFVGPNNALQDLDWKRIMSFSTIKKIRWNFNPPTAAWWGGWWERMIRMLKELLRRILSRSILKHEELETILCDCEVTINSRPLTYIDDNSEGLKPLTPSNFMQGIPSAEVPDLDEIDHNSLNKRLRYLQKLRSDLRIRFRNEYLAMLVHRGRSREDTLQVGDVVILESPGKRINWPLGLIVEIFPGADGHSRVARIKTAEGEKIRPFQRIYSLEIRSPEIQFFNLSKDNIPAVVEISSGSTKPTDDGPVLAPSVAPDIRTRTGRRIKIPTRLDL